MMKLPNDFISRYQAIFKDEFEAFIKGFDLPRSYGLRINPFKCPDISTNPYLSSILRKNPLVEDGYYYDEIVKPGLHPYHFAGVYYIQDPSAMMVVENADIKPGEVVFDMCGAPGGKSTHILSKLQDKGLLITNDILPKRAKVLSENIERWGRSNSIVISTDPTQLKDEFYGYFDKVIVDAPCSGEGMFRKDPEIIENWSVKKIKACSLVQRSLLDAAYNLVKENGIIIYSTCTFAPEEDEEVLAYFLEKYPDLELLPTIKGEGIQDGLGEYKACSRFYFHRFNGEGHFIAKIRKTSPTPTYRKSKSKSLKPIIKEQQALLNEFIDCCLTDFSLNYPIYEFNNHLYTLETDEQVPNLDGINILRYGLHLGEVKKDRFEPSHALALRLSKDQVKHYVDFPHDSKEIRQYLKGETITYPGNNHFTLITVDGYSLGWAKHVDSLLKNYYPKGLRIVL
ncbi:MAG: NOL1/NOP2/sun family putative RNA methylase [Bacilli bacterium]|nr:NOL1/NOP2/sun family putative RNA methylase [Bacilli bacterium]